MKTKIKAVRGTRFLIAKEDAKPFHNEVKIYVKNVNMIMNHIYPFLQELISHYGPNNITVSGQYILIQTLDTEITGFDGVKYELAQEVKNRKKGRQTWFTPAEQEPGDILVNPPTKKLKDTQLARMCESLLPACKKQYVFDLYQYVFNRIKSRQRQVKSKADFPTWILNRKRPPLLRRETIHSPRKLFSIKEGCIVYAGHAGDISCPYSKVLGDFSDGSCGGNLKITRGSHKKHDVFVVVTDAEIEFEYSPTRWVGFDINKKADYWLAFYDNRQDKSWVWSLSQYGRDLLKLRADLNKEIDNASKSNLSSKDRREKRIQVVKHITRRQNKFIRKVFTPLLSTLKANRAGLAIDDIQPGAGSGSFFQDSITNIVPKLCEEMGVPYTMVKPSFTSRDCSVCGNRATAAQKQKMGDIYSCPKCGHTELIHINAAKNITNRGAENHGLLPG